MKKILFYMIALCLCACDSAEKKKPAKETPIEQTTTKEEIKEVPKNNDKYVYIDRVKVLHVKKNCVEFLPLMYENASAETTTFLHGIKYILKNKLTHSDFLDYCSQCTEVEDYEEIEKIKCRRWLYNKFVTAGYNVGKDYDEFNSLMENNTASRIWAYSTAKNEGWDVGEIFEGYEDFIGNKENNRIILYNTLSKDYDLGTYEQFITDIQDSGKLNKLYNAMKDKGYTDIGNNFEEFTNLFIN